MNKVKAKYLKPCFIWVYLDGADSILFNSAQADGEHIGVDDEGGDAGGGLAKEELWTNNATPAWGDLWE